MQGASGGAIRPLSIQFCSYADGVWVDLGDAIESSIDLIDSCNVCLFTVNYNIVYLADLKAYIDKVNAGELASFEPSLQLL